MTPKIEPTSSGSGVNSRKFAESGIYGRKVFRNGFSILNEISYFIADRQIKGESALENVHCLGFGIKYLRQQNAILNRGLDQCAPATGLAFLTFLNKMTAGTHNALSAVSIQKTSLYASTAAWRAINW